MNSPNLRIITTIVAIILCKNVAQSKPVARIVNGTQAAEGHFPYFVDMGSCGGTLIAPDVVLSAAHCGNFTNKQVNIGAYEPQTQSYGSEPRFCIEWRIHPKFGEGGAVNFDFGLCKLDTPVDVDESFVQLDLNDDDNFPAIGEQLIVIGMGSLAEKSGGPPFLQNVTVPAMSNDDCNKEESYNGKVTDEMMCAGFPDGQYDSCQGDSGGPLVQRIYQNDGTFVDKHVGVVSWGAGCGRANKPGVYARTSKAIDFILETTCNAFQSQASFCENNTPLASVCDTDLNVRVTTDIYAFETNWTLRDIESGDMLTFRKYTLNEYVNDDTICIEKNKCYQFEMNDKFGDGMCGSGPCGGYSLSTNTETFVEVNSNFGSKDVNAFCVHEDGSIFMTDTIAQRTPPPTNAPTASPTENEDEGVFCKADDTSVNFQKNPKKKKKKNCKKFIKGSTQKRIKKCNKMFKFKGIKKPVYEWCPTTCDKVGVGKCGRR